MISPERLCFICFVSNHVCTPFIGILNLVQNCFFGALPLEQGYLIYIFLCPHAVLNIIWLNYLTMVNIISHVLIFQVIMLHALFIAIISPHK